MPERHSEWTEVRIRWADWDAMQAVIDAARTYESLVRLGAAPDRRHVARLALLDATRALDSDQPPACRPGADEARRSPCGRSGTSVEERRSIDGEAGQ